MRQERRRQRHPGGETGRWPRGDPASLRALLRGPGGLEHLTRGSTCGPWYAVSPGIPPASAKDGERGEEKSRAPELRQVELSNKSSLSPEGPCGPGRGGGWAWRWRAEVEGAPTRARGGAAGSRERFLPLPRRRALCRRAPPPDLFPAPGREVEGKGLVRCPRGGEGAGGVPPVCRTTPGARVEWCGWRPWGWRSLTAPAAGNLPRQPAACPARPLARAPEGRYLSPWPPEPPGRERSARPAPARRQRQQKARGEGGGEEHRNRSFRWRSPAGIGRRSPRRSAAQRSGGAGAPASWRAPRAGTSPVASPPRLPPRTPGGRPSPAGPSGTQRREGPMVSPCFKWSGMGSEFPSPPVLPTPILGCPRSDLPPRVTPPGFPSRCSTCP